jgi:Domain of unknown function (DUF222)
MNTTTLSVASFEPIDTLEKHLVESWQTVSRATHRFLKLLREFDLRQGWKAYGNVDCADWLNWRCGISRVTAQEKLRIARSLWHLPKVDEAFALGELSYSKVRALTRVAIEKSEAELLHFARHATAAQVEAYCRRLRNGDSVASAVDAKRLHESRSLIRHPHDDGSGTITVELPEADFALVMQALEFVASTLPDDPTRSLFAKGADALVQMAREALAGHHGTGSAAEVYQVLVHIDASALANAGGEADLPLPTVRRLSCDGTMVPIVKNDDGTPLNVGRKTRTVPTSIRRALAARDRTCVFPGCHHERFLDIHHVQHWADGGETSLSNTLRLCTTHHKLVHEGGFKIVRHPNGQCHFARPDGRPVEVGSVHSTNDRVEEAHAQYGLENLPRKTAVSFRQTATRRTRADSVWRAIPARPFASSDSR